MFLAIRPLHSSFGRISVSSYDLRLRNLANCLLCKALWVNGWALWVDEWVFLGGWALWVDERVVFGWVGFCSRGWCVCECVCVFLITNFQKNLILKVL